MPKKQKTQKISAKAVEKNKKKQKLDLKLARKKDKNRKPMTRAQLKVRNQKLARKQFLDRKKRLEEARLKNATKFQIKCRRPVEDDIFDVDEFVKYLKERFKVDGKTGVVGAGRPVNIHKTQENVNVLSKKPFPKFYLKYLTKRYLKRNGLRDYVRVIADKKGSYELRYFNIQEDKQAGGSSNAQAAAA